MIPLPHGTRCNCRGQCGLHQGPCVHEHRRMGPSYSDGKTRDQVVYRMRDGLRCGACRDALADKRPKVDASQQLELVARRGR